MNTPIYEISIPGLAIAFLPALIVIGILYNWRAGAGTGIYASLRMLIQLLLVGYVLVYIFRTDNVFVIGVVLAVMLTAASWIAIRPLANQNAQTFWHALIAIAATSIPVLVLVTQAVVNVEPWFSPRYVIPFAGMIIAGAMNAVSLAGERFEAETANDVAYEDARRSALDTALIPIVKSLFAVGVVTLPGTMTGQVLSGVSPLIAAKYQIVVMTMLFGTTGLAAAIYIGLAKARARSGL